MNMFIVFITCVYAVGVLLFALAVIKSLTSQVNLLVSILQESGRIVSYNPHDYSTCTIIFHGDTYYYKLERTTKQTDRRVRE